MKQIKTIFSTLSMLAVLASAGVAQMSTGVDIYSRYIWRGSDYGNSPSLQPSLSYATGGLTVGVWGSYALSSGGGSVDSTGSISSTTYAEADIWASYGIGPVTLYFTDYYIPSYPPAITFFNYSNNGGAHVLEAGAGYSGPESFPVSVSGYVLILNDKDNSIYLEASYPILSDLNLTAGITPAKSSFYGTEKAGLINAGISTTKTIKVTESFSIPFKASYIMNPYTESAYLIFGITL